LASPEAVGDGVGFLGERDKIVSVFVTKYPDGGAGVIISAGASGRWAGSGGRGVAQPASSVSSSAVAAQAVLGECIADPRHLLGSQALGLAGVFGLLELAGQRIARDLAGVDAPAGGEGDQQ